MCLGNIMQVFLPVFIFKVKPFHVHIHWLGIQLPDFNPAVQHPSFGISFSPLHHTLLFLQSDLPVCFPTDTHSSSKVCTMTLCPPHKDSSSIWGENPLTKTWAGMLQSCPHFPHFFFSQERHYQALHYLQTPQNKSSLVPLRCWAITSKFSQQRATNLRYPFTRNLRAQLDPRFLQESPWRCISREPTCVWRPEWWSWPNTFPLISGCHTDSEQRGRESKGALEPSHS